MNNTTKIFNIKLQTTTRYIHENLPLFLPLFVTIINTKLENPHPRDSSAQRMIRIKGCRFQRKIFHFLHPRHLITIKIPRMRHSGRRPRFTFTTLPARDCGCRFVASMTPLWNYCDGASDPPMTRRDLEKYLQSEARKVESCAVLMQSMSWRNVVETILFMSVLLLLAAREEHRYKPVLGGKCLFTFGKECDELTWHTILSHHRGNKIANTEVWLLTFVPDKARNALRAWGNK